MYKTIIYFSDNSYSIEYINFLRFYKFEVHICAKWKGEKSAVNHSFFMVYASNDKKL